MKTPIDEKLSKNFTWGEMTKTGQTALADKNREEAEKYKMSIKAIAEMLQVVRDHWGAIRVNSCFRGPAVNAGIKGASKISQHMLGEAVDFVPMSEGVTLEMVFDWIRHESKLPFGQVILEKPSPTSQWIHLSLGEPYRPKNNRQALFFDGKTYTPVK